MTLLNALRMRGLPAGVGVVKEPPVVKDFTVFQFLRQPESRRVIKRTDDRMVAIDGQSRNRDT